MKKTILLCLFGGSLAFVSCNSDGMSATAKKNLEVNKAIMNDYEKGDFSKMGDYIAADAVDHGSDVTDVKGLDNIVAMMKKYRESVTDMKYTTLKELADDEYVFSWMQVDCTMEGKPTKMTSLDVSKFKDGKCVEHWVYMDPNDMMKMMQDMGAGAPAVGDSLK